MSWIITTIKIISFLFPFLKELFIGKGNNASRKGKVKEPNELLKTIIIVLGCASVALNFYLISRSYSLGRENLELQKQVKEPTPRPVQYPNNTPTPIPRRVIETVEDKPNKNNNPNKKVVTLPPALPPDRENYLKELEEINKIHWPYTQ